MKIYENGLTKFIKSCYDKLNKAQSTKERPPVLYPSINKENKDGN